MWLADVSHCLIPSIAVIMGLLTSVIALPDGVCYLYGKRAMLFARQCGTEEVKEK